MSESDKNFFQGYICAVANFLRERDRPSEAQGLLNSIGKITPAKLKEWGVDRHDITTLRKYKLIEK